MSDEPTFNSEVKRLVNWGLMVFMMLLFWYWIYLAVRWVF